MNALAYRVRRQLRREWRSTLIFALVVALAGTTVLAIAAGAVRTGRAPDRYVASLTNLPDVSIVQETGLSRDEEIAFLPSVASVASMTFMMAGLMREGAEQTLDGLVFAGSATATGATLTSGREPDPAQSAEFVATRTFVEAAGATIGDTFRFVSLTADQADRFGFSVEIPEGPTFEATLVGVVDGFRDGDPSQPKEPLAFFGSSVLTGVDIAVRSSVMTVNLTPGADVRTLRADLDTLPQADQLRVDPIQPVSESVRSAVRAQVSGLWVLVSVAALATVAALGQFAGTRTRLTDAERSNLVAIGLTSRQVTVESVVRASLPILAGSAVAVVGAYASSSVFPTGIARPLEPHLGLRFDAVVLLCGSVVMALAVVLWAWFALAVRTTRSSPAELRSLVERLAVACPTPTASTGLRFAYARSRLGTGFARAATVGVLLAVAGIVGSISVGSSVDRLVSDPQRQGRSFDAVFGNAGETVPSAELRLGLEADSDIEGLTLLATGQARNGDSTVFLIGFERLRGPDALRALEGRLPISGDEIALGRLAARDLNVHPGDQVPLTGATSTVTFTVTGLVVMPSIGGGDGVGEDGLVTIDGLQRLDDTAVGVGLGLNLRSDAPAEALDRIAGDFGLEAQDGLPEVPLVVENLGRVQSVPYVLAVVLSVLGLITLAHTMFASVRNRRRDLAILTALGANRRWVMRVVRWQATAFAFVPLILGIPAGFLVARYVFGWVADSIGAANDPSFPYTSALTFGVALLTLANLSAIIPARRARQIALTRLLHPE